MADRNKIVKGFQSVFAPVYDPFASWQRASSGTRKALSAAATLASWLLIAAVSVFLVMSIFGAPAGLAGLGVVGAGIATAISSVPLWAAIIGLAVAGAILVGSAVVIGKSVINRLSRRGASNETEPLLKEEEPVLVKEAASETPEEKEAKEEENSLEEVAEPRLRSSACAESSPMQTVLAPQ